jgi:hypothetical protein
MTDDNGSDELLTAAMEGLVRTDPDLEGASVVRWYVIGEFERGGDERTLSIFRSQNSLPWHSLGLLEFAQIMERGAITQIDD